MVSLKEVATTAAVKRDFCKRSLAWAFVMAWLEWTTKTVGRAQNQSQMIYYDVNLHFVTDNCIHFALTDCLAQTEPSGYFLRSFLGHPCLYQTTNKTQLHLKLFRLHLNIVCIKLFATQMLSLYQFMSAKNQENDTPVKASHLLFVFAVCQVLVPAWGGPPCERSVAVIKIHLN